MGGRVWDEKIRLKKGETMWKGVVWIIWGLLVILGTTLGGAAMDMLILEAVLLFFAGWIAALAAGIYLIVNGIIYIVRDVRKQREKDKEE